MIPQKNKTGYSFFTNSGNGNFELADDTLIMQGWKNLKIKKTHVMELTKISDLALNKVEVEMKYFDMFGGNELLRFAMRDSDFKAMKSTLGK
ncbi:hypothetical protein HY989_00920 [Candidatus Micrarchaeota archaeon]|nr:hypothetical protein [Candidatus Micrarchaeota archaeon]